MVQLQNNIYSAWGNFDLAPAGVNGFQFDLTLNRNRFKIKNINYQYRINELNNAYIIPALNNTVSELTFSCGSILTVPTYFKTFNNIIIPPGGNILNGVIFQMFLPGQQFFDNWIIEEVLPIQINGANYDLFDTLTFFWNLTIEIEPINFV